MDFLALASDCAAFVDPQTLAAIVKTESNYQPFSIGVNGGSRLERQPVNLEEAVVTAQWLLDNGYNIDLGLGQVNSSNLHRVGLTVHDAFDPCKNLKAAGTIFNTSYQAAMRQYPEGQAFQAALSAYNTGNFIQGFENGYVQKVIDNLPDKARSPASATAPTVAVQPIPLVNGNKPALPYSAKAQHPDSQPASLSVGQPQTVAQALVYAHEGNREGHYPEEVVAGSVGNAYGSDMATVMVYR